eukprot:IDg1344t1
MGNKNNYALYISILLTEQMCFIYNYGIELRTACRLAHQMSLHIILNTRGLINSRIAESLEISRGYLRRSCSCSATTLGKISFLGCAHVERQRLRPAQTGDTSRVQRLSAQSDSLRCALADPSSSQTRQPYGRGVVVLPEARAGKIEGH